MKYLFLAILMSSCAINNQKKALKHFKKFEYYGGSIVDKIDTIRIETIVKGKDGKDSVIYQIVKFDCPNVVFPKSKTEIRQINKKERAEIRNKRKENKHVKKAETKQLKSNIKKEIKNINCWNFWDKLKFAILVFCITHVIRYIWLIIKIFIKMPL